MSDTELIECLPTVIEAINVVAGTSATMTDFLKCVAEVFEDVKKYVTAEEAPRPLTLLTWEDAVRFLRHTCVEAPECGPGCPMYGWCWSNLPPRNAPEYWTAPGAGA